eukprot:scaffold2400_cov187-Cylindrotheca_fusiformis.AAC.8
MTLSDLMHGKGDKRDRKTEHSSFNGIVTSRNGMICQPSSVDSTKKEEQCPSENSVGALISKSKKAAASLFTLLHAKNCTLGPNRCHHPGCPEAKLIHLHLKVCRASRFEVARSRLSYKLFNLCSTRLVAQKLVKCARHPTRDAWMPENYLHIIDAVETYAHAKLPTKSRSTSPKSRSNSKHLIPSLKLSADQSPSSQMQPLQHLRARPRSISMPAQELPPSETISKAFSSPQMMPPPPPRFTVTRAAGKLNSSISATLDEAVNRALNVPRSDEPISSTNRGTPSNAIASGNLFRPRSESFDISHAPVELSTEQDEFAESGTDNEFKAAPPARRRRSASCHILSSSSQSEEFHAIREAPVGDELQAILEGEK